LNGEEVFKKAKAGDENALKLYNELGTHLGNAIKMILYTYDMELIVLGGSVPQAYDLFEKTMWERINTFGFPKSLEQLQVTTSELANSGILGAAALYYDSA